MHHLSFDELDEITRPAPHLLEFEEVANKMISRRIFLGGGVAVGAGAGAFVMGPPRYQQEKHWRPVQTSPVLRLKWSRQMALIL